MGILVKEILKMKNDFKSMNFVYYSESSYKAIVIGHIRYQWGDIDIRDYLSEDTIQNAEDIIIAANGGNIRVLHYGKINPRRKYQVVSEFTKYSDIKSKYILICPERMKWELGELTSEGEYESNEQYIEIVDNDVKEMDLLELASNLSYMYGYRFVPRTIEQGSVYRITMDNKKAPSVWKDVEKNIESIKKAYKLDNVFVDKARKKTKVNANLVKAKDFGWEW